MEASPPAGEIDPHRSHSAGRAIAQFEPAGGDDEHHIVGVLDKIREDIPYDATETPSMKQLCTSTEAGPLDFPLHPGAESYYRDKGYL